MRSSARAVPGRAAAIAILLAFMPGCASSQERTEAGADIRKGAEQQVVDARDAGMTTAHPANATRTTIVEYLNSGKVLPKNLPFSEAVRVGDVLYLSGQIGVLPGTLTLAPGGTRAEARQAMENIRATLEAHGRSMRDVVKCTVMLADMSEWSAFNEVYVGFFSPPYPARSALGANGLALGARVEVECIAAITAE
jgi:reactive intermediate/imine deaminase